MGESNFGLWRGNASPLPRSSIDLNTTRYFRDLMRVLSDDSLARLLRDDQARAEITDYTWEKLADWQPAAMDLLLRGAAADSPSLRAARTAPSAGRPGSRAPRLSL